MMRPIKVINQILLFSLNYSRNRRLAQFCANALTGVRKTYNKTWKELFETLKLPKFFDVVAL